MSVSFSLLGLGSSSRKRYEGARKRDTKRKLAILAPGSLSCNLGMGDPGTLTQPRMDGKTGCDGSSSRCQNHRHAGRV